MPKEANLALRIGDEIVWGPTAAKFYVAVWRWIIAHGHVKVEDLPLRSGSRRYILATSPVYPTGTKFFQAREVAPGMWLEAHMSRANISQRAKKSLGGYGIASEVLVGVEP